MPEKIKVLVGCQNDGCAEEVSYYLDMVAMYEGRPICENCYQDGDYGDPGDKRVKWGDLPPVTLADLCA